METPKTTSTPSAWTEVEYSARCMSPYLATPVYIPEETSYFLCREDGTREQHRQTFVVFRADGSDEWEDDPMVGRLQMAVLGDDDEEVCPAEGVYLGTSPERFVSVVRDDDDEIVFDITWSLGSVDIPCGTKTDEGWVVKKSAFGDDGVACRLTPRRGSEFSIRLTIPYVGFALCDASGNRLDGEIEVSAADAGNYTYAFVGDGQNDRFQLSLDGDKLNYMCVLADDGRLSVRDMRERLALVGTIDATGTLDTLLMGAHSALVKNKSARWRILLVGESMEGADAVQIDGVALARFAFEQFAKTTQPDEEQRLAERLMGMEQRYGFQWMWMGEADWSHDNLDGLIDMDGLDADPEKMMRQALLYNRYETFMKHLAAFSYISHKPIQGDQLQARNNKRKIARCVRHVLAHRNGDENIWRLDEEARREILHFFSTFHREFTVALEEAK